MSLFFDLDGTIVDVAARHYEAYRRVVDANGDPTLAFEALWSAKRAGASWGDILAGSGARLDPATFVRRFAHGVEQLDVLGLDTLVAPGVLNDLANEHRIYLVTHRWHRYNLMAELERLDILALFADVISAPAPRGDQAAKAAMIGALAVVGDVMIGDTESDVLAAQKLGITSIAVLSGLRDEAFLRNLHPDHVIDTIGDVPSLLAP